MKTPAIVLIAGIIAFSAFPSLCQADSRGNFTHSALLDGRIGHTSRTEAPLTTIILAPQRRIHQFTGHNIYGFAQTSRHRHSRWCNWTGGYYQQQRQQVWIYPYFIQRYVPPTYDMQIVNGRWSRALTMPGHYVDHLIPGHYEQRDQPLWIPGRWSCGF